MIRDDSQNVKQPNVKRRKNAPTHSSLIVTKFLVQKSVAVINHPCYSSDLVSANFFLFPKLKKAFKRTCFENLKFIKNNLTEVLKAILNKEYSRTFQRLYERC